MSDSNSTLTTNAAAKRAGSKRKYHATEKGKATTAAYNKRYAELHKEEIQQRRRQRALEASEERRARDRALAVERRAKNADRINERRRAALQSDEALRERAKERSRAWYAKNKDRVLERACEYYRENKPAIMEKIKAYEARNPEKAAVWRLSRVHARRARILGSGGRFTKGDVDRLMALQRCKCANCGKSLKGGHHIDHRVPISKGGGNDPENLELLCPPCNYAKGAKLPHVFAQENGRLL